MGNSITYVGMDVHKKDHKIAMFLPGRQKPEEWVVQNNAKDLARMARRIAAKAPGAVRICYEAGVCGFALKRQLDTKDIECVVIAPSLVPVKPGQKIKTDRRDARKLAMLLRADMLTEVRPPNEAEETVRDIVRCREAAQQDLLRIRHQLSKFLLRRAIIYRDGVAWTQKHLRWLRGLRFDQPAAEHVFRDCLAEMLRRKERVDELTEAVNAEGVKAPYAQVVGWLRCFRGIDTLAAMTIVTELHGFERFTSPRELMSYLGLTPSEQTSAEHVRKGGITWAGNARVRRILTEAAWHQSKLPAVSKALRARRASQPAWAVQLADQAMQRLYRRYWRLVSRGKLPTKAAIAVARELVGFLWSALYLREASLDARRRPRRQKNRDKRRTSAAEFFAVA